MRPSTCGLMAPSAQRACVCMQGDAGHGEGGSALDRGIKRGHGDGMGMAWGWQGDQPSVGG